ncbi:MAG: hypothetical protein ABWX68_02355 [Arthrobacter sp.]|uniref:hypothetical protein n=1 Tax=Arthrobacter sp. TaxID=1667 RepID=UPI00347488E4
MFDYEKATYLPELTDEAIDTITHYVPRKNNPLSVTLIYRPDGAHSDAGEDDTAFEGQRTPRCSVFVIAVAPNRPSSPPSGSGSGISGMRCNRRRNAPGPT